MKNRAETNKVRVLYFNCGSRSHCSPFMLKMLLKVCVGFGMDVNHIFCGWIVIFLAIVQVELHKDKGCLMHGQLRE